MENGNMEYDVISSENIEFEKANEETILKGREQLLEILKSIKKDTETKEEGIQR